MAFYVLGKSGRAWEATGYDEKQLISSSLPKFTVQIDILMHIYYM